ncbi:MAG: LysM peptidoglycan-binding domain-containing protein [Prevotellaceae bacterium]|jgi:LysM repeat protein|nr:LysM peptidoglycan-binding domain-containing protein [Prevotellaceae bacterium]
MKKNIILFFLLCIAPCMQAQDDILPPPVTTSSEQVRIEGKVYYIHLVLKKQTLYSISRHYGVSVDELKALNPQLTEGLKEGDRLKIPVIKGHIFSDNQAQEQTYYTHLVLKKQTLYSISRHYGVSMDELKALNPQLADGLKEGDHLKIPVVKTTVPPDDTTKNTAAQTPPPPASDIVIQPFTAENILPLADSVDSTSIQPPYGAYLEETQPPCGVQPYDPETTAYRIALVLPFEKLPTSEIAVSDTSKEILPERLHASNNFMEFYAGFLLALEDMKRQGFSFYLSVYDENNLDALMQQDQFRYADLVIGPVYASSLKTFLPYAQERKINVVSPLDPKAETLLRRNPTFFQVPPVFYAQQEKLTEHIPWKTDRVLLIYEEDGKEDKLVQSYKTMLNAKADTVITFHYKVAKGLLVRDNLRPLLSRGIHNHIVVASNNEALVSDVASNLSYLHTILKYPATLYGQAAWRNFENVDLTYFHHMNLHLAVPFVVDYRRGDVRRFVARFHVQFKADPSQYAFQGYDVAFYFATALRNYGKDFAGCLSGMTLELLQGDYIFRRPSSDAGYLNTGSCLITYTPDFFINKETRITNK